MKEQGGIRVWRGWRKETVAWDKFIRHLATIFIPATWQVMGRLGLRLYVPSVLAESKPEGMPDEVALLFYPSQSAYLAARFRSAAGRAYGLLHEAVFAFTPERRSTSTTAVSWSPGQPAPLQDQPFHRQATGNGCRFCAAQRVVFLALSHQQAPSAMPGALFAVLGQCCDEAVVYGENAFTLAWLAVRNAGEFDRGMLAAELASRLPASTLVAVHAAERMQFQVDYFAEFDGLALQSDQTLFFLPADRIPEGISARASALE